MEQLPIGPRPPVLYQSIPRYSEGALPNRENSWTEDQDPHSQQKRRRITSTSAISSCFAEAFLLNDEARADKNTGGNGQNKSFQIARVHRNITWIRNSWQTQKKIWLEIS